MKKLLLFASMILLSGSLLAQQPQHRAKGDSCKVKKECKHKEKKCKETKTKTVENQQKSKPTPEKK